MLCGAKTRSGKPCKNKAGYKTDHVGQGRCHLHGGASPIRHGRYSTIQRPRIRELLDQFESDPSPMDLLPEVKLLRALVTDFIERWDENSEVTFRWHALFTAAYQDAVNEWREKMIALLEDGGYEHVVPEELPPVPDPLDYAPEKPRQLLDITAAAGLVDKVGAMVDRIEKHKREGSVTLETMNRVLEQLGVDVVNAAREAVSSEAERAALLRNVERRWNDVRLDPATARAGPTTSARDLN